MFNIFCMKKLLIIGNAPLPNESTKSRPAAGLRTYQFLKPFLGVSEIEISDKDHAFSAKKGPAYVVTLVTIAMPDCYEDAPGNKEIRHSDKFSEFQISKDDSNLLPTIQKIHDEFIPDAIISVNTYPSYIASSLTSQAPLWCDLNGWIMAEAQAQAYKMNSNNYLAHYFQMESAILKRADKISTVSKAQAHAVTGELGFIGRLNGETFPYRFTHTIPNGTEFFDEEESIVEGNYHGDEAKTKEVSEKIEKIFDTVPGDTFVLLWMGGYNTWVDEITLFKSVEDSMEKCHKLYFVSTGGEIPGLDNETFIKFKKMIGESKYKDRFVFLGWVDTKDIPYIYLRSNAGLNVDRKCTETFTGARNRINEMMKFKVPVITTLGSEISYEVARIDAGIAVESGKHEELTSAIEKMYIDFSDHHGYKIKEYGQNGYEYIKKECNYETLLKPLIDWLENPRQAPDRNIDVSLKSKFSIRTIFTYIKKSGIKKFLRKALQKTKSFVSKIASKIKAKKQGKN